MMTLSEFFLFGAEAKMGDIKIQPFAISLFNLILSSSTLKKTRKTHRQCIYFLYFDIIFKWPITSVPDIVQTLSGSRVLSGFFELPHVRADSLIGFCPLVAN